jgi:hypothetical protein
MGIRRIPEMNGRLRLIKLLNGEEIDRIPVAPFIFNNYINEFFGQNDADPVIKGIEVYKHFGFDIILRTCNVWDYLNENACDSKYWRVSESRQETGNEWSVYTTIKTPERELKQKKQYKRVTEYEVVEAVTEYFIKDKDDFEQFVKYQPPVPSYDCSIITRARELLKDDGLCAPWVQGAFNMISFYRKLDDLILDPYLDPSLYDQMIRYFADRMLNVIGQFAKAGADIVCAGGNIGNASMVGPVFFKDHILPYEIEFAKRAKSKNVYYLYHNCGDASLLLDMYSDIGMDIYESLTPPPYGDTSLSDALTKIDKHITLCGNIDQIGFLRNSTPKQIRQSVKTVLMAAKKRGNFILATTDYFSEGTPYENILAFAKAGLEFGQYT